MGSSLQDLVFLLGRARHGLGRGRGTGEEEGLQARGQCPGRRWWELRPQTALWWGQPFSSRGGSPSQGPRFPEFPLAHLASCRKER